MSAIYFDRGQYPEEAAALESIEPKPGTAFFGIDLSMPADGLAAMIAARRAGTICALFPILPDPLEGVLAAVFNAIAANANPDGREEQLEALRNDGLLVNDKKPADFAVLSKENGEAATLALLLADIVLVGSPAERRHWSDRLGRTLRRIAVLPVIPTRRQPPAASKTVTIYAPSTATELTHIYAHHVRARRFEPQIISAANPNDPIASPVVITPEWRSMRARALAAAGYRVVAPNTTNADSADARIFGFEPTDFLDFFRAFDAALTAPSGGTAIDATSEHTAAAVAAVTPSPSNSGRASIIVRTYNRPALLARSIASIARQTYADVEIVVVNNGGEDVRAVVESAAQGRPYRYEVMPERKLIGAASNVGARAATGTYVGYLDDDDLLYGDHCATAIAALERTGVDLVFTQCLGEFAQVSGETKTVLGYRVYIDRVFEIENTYATNMAPIHSIMHPRTVFERFGYFDEALPVTDDWELWLRVVSKGGRILHVDRVTCEYSWRYDVQRGNMSIDHQWDFVNAFEAISARYPIAPDRPRLLQRRHNTYEHQRRRATEGVDAALRAEIVIGSMSEGMVPVSPVPES